jgi:hypothetical protein
VREIEILKIKKSEIEQLREEVETYRKIGREMKQDLDDVRGMLNLK